MRNTIVALAIAATLSSTACGDDVQTARPVAQDLAGAICDIAFRCCQRGEVDLFLGPFLTEQDCADRLVNQASIATEVLLGLEALELTSVDLPNIAVLNRALEEGRSEINGDQLDTCIAFLTGIACNEPTAEKPVFGCVAPVPVDDSTPCDPNLLFLGKVKAGGACTSPGFTFECEEGTVCRASETAGLTGACVIAGVQGDFCFSDIECRDDLYCSLLDGTCQAFQGESDTCLYADPSDPTPFDDTLLIRCGFALSCDPITDTCVRACQQGASCFFDGECDSGLLCILGRCDEPRGNGLLCSLPSHCQTTLRCAVDPDDATRTICQPGLGNGATCTASTECASGFCNGTPLTCTAAQAVGGACGSGSDAQCADGWCDTSGASNVCKAPGGEGATCSSAASCIEGSCVAGACRTLPLADGVACSSDFQCDSLFCAPGATSRCKVPPLPNGDECTSSIQCLSGACDGGTCADGLGLGSVCGGAMQGPCGLDLYCDLSPATQVCAVIHEAGEACTSGAQCRGLCVISEFNRLACDETPARDAAVCDGS